MTVDDTLATSRQTPEGQLEALDGILMGEMADPQMSAAERQRVITMRLELLKANPRLAKGARA